MIVSSPPSCCRRSIRSRSRSRPFRCSPLRGVDLGLRLPREALGGEDRGAPGRVLRRHGALVDRLAADWVLPGRGGSDRAAASPSPTDGSPRSAPRTSSRARSAASARRDRPGIRQRPHAPRVRGLRRLRRRARLRALAATHIERKAGIGWDEFLAIARLGAAESLASGVTTIGDASFSGAAAVAAAELGLRGDGLPGDLRRRPGRAVEELRGRLDELESTVDGRVSLGVSPHAPYSASPEVYAAAYDLGLPIATHLAESDDERDYLLRGEGPIASRERGRAAADDSVRHLADRGCCARESSQRTASRSTPRRSSSSRATTSRSSIARARTRCSAAESPPSRELLDAGVSVGLGTDSPASTPSFDMFEEMRAAHLCSPGASRAARRAVG